jgi:hypothetical protein
VHRKAKSSSRATSRKDAKPVVRVEHLRKPGAADLARWLGISADRLQLGKDGSTQVNSLWFEVPLGTVWRAAYLLTVERGQPIVAEVRIMPLETAPKRPAGMWSGEVLGSLATSPPGGITARLLRTVKVGEHQQCCGEILERIRREFPAALLGVGGLDAHPSPHRVRRDGRSDLFYAMAASDYARICERGSRRPTTDLARARDITPSQARDVIYETRQRGWLSAAHGRGRGGGVLTVKAQVLLAARRPRRKGRGTS